MPWTAAAPCELLKLSDMADALHRGVLLILVRLGVAYGLCTLFYALFGYEGFLGISFLAFVCAVTSANAALYMGIISPFGDKADKASFGIMLICSMPLLPLLFLGFEFGSTINLIDAVKTLPRNPEFAQRDLCEDLSAKTAAVEGVKK